jgi:hypothetical protein
LILNERKTHTNLQQKEIIIQAAEFLSQQKIKSFLDEFVQLSLLTAAFSIQIDYFLLENSLRKTLRKPVSISQLPLLPVLI